MTRKELKVTSKLGLRMIEYHRLRGLGYSSYDAKYFSLGYSKPMAEHEADHRLYAAEYRKRMRERFQGAPGGQTAPRLRWLAAKEEQS